MSKTGMCRVVVYGKSTGEILREVVCPEGMADMQAGLGEGWLRDDWGLIDPVLHKINPSTLAVENRGETKDDQESTN